MNICRKCGAVLRDGDKYCSKCGARASRGSAERRRQNAQKRKQEKEITFRTRPANARGYRENFEEGENRTHALLVTVTILVVMMLAVAAFATFYFLRKRSAAGGNSYSSAIEILTDASVRESAAGAKGQGAEGGEAQGAEGAEGQGAAGEEARGAEGQGAAGGEAQGAAGAEGQNAEGGETPGAAGGETQQEPPQSETPAAAGAQSESTAPQSESAAPEDTGQQAAEQTEAETESETEEGTEPLTEAQTEPELPSASEVIDPAQIQAILEKESTAYASEVYVYDLKHDSEAALNDCTEPMYASALITVPILYTAAHLIDEGAMTLDDPVTYVTSIGGRGELTTEIRDGREFPLSFYLQTMVNYSDNNCINILIDHIGLDTINSTCQEAGYTSVNMERGLVAGDPGGLDNYISAKDVTMMVKELYTGAFSSIGTDFMRTFFHISEGDSLPTLVGLAPSLADASAVLNQNGHGMTRYNETAVIEDGGAVYILTIMLFGDSGMVYSPAVTDVAEYVAASMGG